MKKETKDLLTILAENNQDFEWYPTTDEMLEEVYCHINWRGNTQILDIGCGLCGLKKLIDRRNKNKDKNNMRDYDYFAIEKSEILLNKLPSDVYVLGTDFYQCTLIDKDVDVIFCNPPYSEFKEWTKRIICEGNFRQAFLIIPQRWKDFCAIARNLGFSIGHFESANCFGEKFYIYLSDGTPLIEYKLYQNGNTHIKLNIEFAKAINVEVARLLGWIHNKQDIEKEFPETMAKGADKYFGSQFCFNLVNPNIRLLTGA